MSAVTKPPVPLNLIPGTKDAECHRLVRLLVRAYYKPEHVAVMDCLLDLQHRQANKVTEAELSAELHLSPKLVREVLYLLRVHQLVRGIQKADGAERAPVAELTSRGKRKGFVRGPTVTFTWHCEFEHVVKVIQYRHTQIIAQLNPKGGGASSGATFACPNTQCPGNWDSKSNSAKAPRVLDFLKGEVYPDAQGRFLCDLCCSVDSLSGSTSPTVLGLLKQELDPVEDRKKRFNAQLRALQDQLRIVTEILDKERREGGSKSAGAAAAAGAAAGAAAQRKPGQIDFSSAAAAANPAAAAAAGGKGAAASSAAAAAAAHAAAAAAAPSADGADMISVQLAGSAGDTAGLAAAAARESAPSAAAAAQARRAAPGAAAAGGAGATISALASASALPWDRNAPPLSLARVEAERRAQDESRSAAAAAESARLAAEEAARFAREYDEQLAKQTAAAHASQAAAAAASSPAASASDADGAEGSFEEEQCMQLGGRAVALSSVTQDDIDQMTADEFEEYSNLAGEHEEF